jgi:hypothetical protein
MADIGQTDFSIKPDVNIAAIASLYQKKAMDEQQMRLQQSQIQSQQQDRTMNVIKMASDLTQNLIQHSANSQMLQGQQHVQSILGSGNNPTPTMTPAASSFAPGMSQAPVMNENQTAPTTHPLRQEPSYQEQLKQATYQANPKLAQEQLAKSVFMPQLGKGEQLKPVMNPDGTMGYARINMGTGEAQSVPGVQAPASGMNQQVMLTPEDMKNPVLNNIAEAVYQGKATPTQIANLRTANGQKVVAILATNHPDFDLSLAPQRNALRREYTSGTANKNLTSLNTVIGHLDTLENAAENLDNSKLRKYNSVANYVKNETGQPEVMKFNAARNAVSNELGRVFTGVGQVTETEKQAFREDLNAANSPEQIHQVAETYIDLIKSRTDAIKSNWDQTMGGVKPPTPIINDKAKKILVKRGYDPVTMEKTGNPSAGGLNIDQSALDAELKRRGL